MLIISSMLGVHGQSLPFACAGSMESYGVQGSPNSVYEWIVQGGSILDTIYGIGNDTVVVQWDYSRTTHTIEVREETEAGCSGIPVLASVDINAPVADIGDEAEVCQDDVYTFDATTTYSSNVTYLWSDGSTGNTYTTGNPGYVWVRITGADQCYDYDSTYLTQNPLPDIFLGNDSALCGTQSWTLDPGDFSAYEWSTGDISPTLTVSGMRVNPELVWVEVTDANGCKGSDTLVLEICDAAILFAHLTNTITPNGDGRNDEWDIDGNLEFVELFPDAVLEVFDRWGRLVFRSTDLLNDRFKGISSSGKELPMDAYFYVLDIKMAHVKPVTGYINVIR